MNQFVKTVLYIVLAPILFCLILAICLASPVLLLILALYLILLTIIGGLLTLVYLFPYLILNLSSKKLTYVTFIYSLLSFIIFYFIDNSNISKDLVYKIAGISFLSNFAYILSSYLTLLSFDLLEFINFNFNKYKLPSFLLITFINITIEIAATLIYCNQANIGNHVSASVGLMVGTLPLMLATVTYLYIIVGYKSIFKTKQNTKIENKPSTTNLVNTNTEPVSITNTKIYIETCTKEDIKNLIGFNEEKINLFLSERQNGQMWYDIDSFVQFFEIQPHEMIEMMDNLVFPNKPTSKKSTRKIDY